MTVGGRSGSPDDGAPDWRRLAQPQPDQYDSHVTLAFARRRGYARPPALGAAALFDGAVTLCPSDLFPPPCVPAPADHPGSRRGVEALRLWPVGFRQVQLLVDSVSAFVDVTAPEDRVIGCVSGPGPAGFGSVAATVNNHVGFAEAIVHEMAHHKLRALGIEVEVAEGLVTNAPDQLFKSPIRYDRLRPMSAVLHAQYSYTYVAALDVAIVQAAREPARDRRVAEDSLAVILPKLEFGLGVLRAHAETDRPGAEFLSGLYAWTDLVLADGHGILRGFGIPPRPFAHPLDEAAAVEVGVPAPVPAEPSVAERDRPHRAPGVVACELRDELLVYAPDRELAFSLNRSARAVWELCEDRTAREIAEVLGQQLGVGSDALLSDVADAVRRFQELGLLDRQR
jgi:coenzyme PQQ synthesis protein D (PqqD)